MSGMQLMKCGRCGQPMNAPPGVSTVTCPGCRTTLQVPGRAAPPPTYAAPSNAYSSGAGGAGAGTAAAYYPGAAGPGAVASPPMRPPTPRELFMRIDTTRCGRINASQLSAALASIYGKFSMGTTAMIIRMFGHSASATLTMSEFEQLCTYVNAWKDMFNETDSDHTRSISFQELSALLKRMGYTLSPQTLARVWLVYDDDRSGSLTFDEFIMLLAELKMTTSAFARVDTARKGVVTLDYNAYLRLMMSTKVL